MPWNGTLAITPHKKGHGYAQAQTLANTARKRPRPGKIATNTPPRDAIQKLLKKRWSPRQISHQLTIDFPGQPELQVVHESNYQALYSAQKLGFTREMTRHLRAGNADAYLDATIPRGVRASPARPDL